jgi:hypothetical protein
LRAVQQLTNVNKCVDEALVSGSRQCDHLAGSYDGLAPRLRALEGAHAARGVSESAFVEAWLRRR